MRQSDRDATSSWNEVRLLFGQNIVPEQGGIAKNGLELTRSSQERLLIYSYNHHRRTTGFAGTSGHRTSYK